MQFNKNIFTKTFATVTSIVLTGLLMGACSSNNDDKTAEYLLLMGLSQSGSVEAQTSAAQARSAASGISTSISQQASSNSVAGLMQTRNPQFLHALITNKKLLKSQAKAPFAIPTALTRSSGTCDSTGCNAVLSGSLTCPAGGTATLNNMAVTQSYDSSSSVMSIASTMSGGITLASCGTYDVDWINFPNQIAGTTTGDLTFDGSLAFAISNYVVGTNSITQDVVYTEDNTINSSSGLSINGGAATTIASLRSIINLNRAITMTSLSFSNNKYNATVSETVSGTVNVSGTVGGSAVNISRTYNSETFNYSFSCDLSSLDSISCTTTVN